MNRDLFFMPSHREQRGWIPYDTALISDAVSDAFVQQLVQTEIKNPEKLIVTIDHDVPNSTVAVGAKQRMLIDWAVEQGIRLEKCQGIGYLRVLENHDLTHQVMIGTGIHMNGFGAAGALGITCREEDFLDYLQKGEVQLPNLTTLSLSLTGSLPENTSIQDAAVYLFQHVQKSCHSQTLVLLTGDGLASYTMDELFDLCHWIKEAGAFSVIVSKQVDIPVDYELSLHEIVPMVMKPGENSDVCLLKEIMEAVEVQEVFIGGCRGGKIADLRNAASVLRNHKVQDKVRLIIAPATSSVYCQALREGLISDFLNAGALIMNQGCSVCWGKAQGILDDGEVLVSTGSYHYPGCAGSKTAKVYLVSPAIAAGCAITGRLYGQERIRE
ncbi:MAG: aconitase family protein [Megasphaera sp.]|uniref:aconitase family protein n=1 Tax=unclassified Megasphaera TaxID=2626256 RepID=UPI003A80C1C7